jgi:Holliday junction DNA helicase RuvA
MYNHIRGRLIEKNPASVVVEANGIGYQVNISLNTYTRLPNSEAVLLYTHLVVREDSWQLFGFADEHERLTFKQLISVSGVGPNTARVILSSLTASEVETAILMDNIGLLTAVKGIGAKTAQRIVLDLKDKMGKGVVTSFGTGSISTNARSEAVQALEILGFSRIQVEKVVTKLLQANSELGVEGIVKDALRLL